jgi:protein deglycase
MPSVLVPFTTGFEEIETLAPVDILRRAGVEVVMASLSDSIHVTGRSGITIHADATLAGLDDAMAFDLLLIPGGPHVKAMREDGRCAALAKAYAATSKLVAAICAAPTVLLDAGLLGSGRRFTSHVGVAEELPARIADERVVEDGNVITSQGAATSVDFAMALVARLCGKEKAAEVARGIMLW